ncbi:uncharacterized protein LOC111519329 [Drosophila willistoni]|uniref:uncharacterized protein LOC111519329 n=1 Tax=Drosophila willistoni TaxID=7260 RepID=UPI001F07FC6C|nr:uncharacterized protein LOC111519329 [Drosophila willistoni]
MCFNWLVLYLFGMTVLCHGKSTYDVRLESFVGLEGEEKTLVNYTGIKLVGRERFLNGSTHFAIDLIDDVKISCKLFTLEVGIWVPMVYGISQITPCELSIAYFLNYINPDNLNTNYPKDATAYCPLPKGEYWIIDDWVSFMKRGLVKLHMEYWLYGKGIGGFEIVANVYDRIF